MTGSLRIKNWNEFQHFKDRNPPWIKLHKNILENRDISTISDCSFRVLVGLWLLASEDEHKEGRLPELDDIVFRLRTEKDVIINALKELTEFVYCDDITAISQHYQGDDTEAEAEAEAEAERELEAEEEYMFDDFWNLYPEKSSKKAAKAKYEKIIKDGTASHDEIMLGVERYNAFLALPDNDYRKPRGPVVWLNNENWNDELDMTQKPNGGATGFNAVALKLAGEKQ